ncbi:Calx-beta domain-containing protein [Maribacter luteus]|uniref:Calx-beta domain-containing protein n=1 Tax=Maribacter luteus TaxID=2594478 RepID=UPI0024911C0C|nr:Calx-beta domain-containing protein [Maribacter luteus]
MMEIKFPGFYIVLIFLFLGVGVQAQATITIEVNWPNWSSENRVTFRDPSNTQIGGRICNPAACYNGFGNNSYNNIGSPQTYTGVPYGTNYDIYLEDRYGDGWNGGGSYVRVYQDGVLILSSDLTSGSTRTVSFDIIATAPALSIGDVSVNEDDGTATFTVSHIGNNAGGAFTANYQTVNGSALSGTHYTASTGTLNFNGNVGDMDQFTIPIIDNSLYDGDKAFSIQLTFVSDPSVIISDVGSGTIVDDEVVLFNQPLALYDQFNGYYGYTSTGGSLRANGSSGNVCTVNASSSNSLTSDIPAGAKIEKAYLYWAHSGANPDTQVTFEGNSVTADLVYGANYTGGFGPYYGCVSDVTSIISGIASPNSNSFDFSGLTIDNGGSYCGNSTVLGGWSLIVFYEDTSLSASTINIYQGFNPERYSNSSFTMSGFFAIGTTGAKTTVLSWEGDQNFNASENLTVNTGLGNLPLIGDGDNSFFSRNPFNSTIFDNSDATPVNDTNAHGMDLDTYDFSSFVLPGETSVTVNVQSGQDLVIMNAVILKVPSNLISGTVFEDVNYGGGIGRNLATASGVPVQGARVELYNVFGFFVESTTTDANGKYIFAGMANGNYSVRVVNNTVKSSRGGGAACSTCIPVQTFKTYFASSAKVEVTNEVGGAYPSGVDSGAGNLTGAQTIATVQISSEGALGLDFGFNFNTIVNTNGSGQGSLEQFILNSNTLGETGLDIEANGIFDPAAGEDTSVFMIPPPSDPLGRTADANYSSGYFDIDIPNGSPLPVITDNDTHIDGRTQTAYSGNSDAGTVGSGGTTVGISATVLPSYDRPEIQVHRNGGDVLVTQGSNTIIRNISVYADNNAAIRVDGGSTTIINNLLGVNALGSNAGNVDYGVEITDGTMLVDGNYIATNTDAGIFIDGGTSSTIQNNQITANGDAACDDNITIENGSGIVIQQNLVENAASLGIDGDGITGGVLITENTVTSSGQDGGNCGGNVANAGIRLDGSNSTISNNIIASNGGPGLVLAGGNTSGNLISQNSFYGNGTASDALGIDLDASDAIGDGVTLNDNSDADAGPNGAMNFPVISLSNITGTSIVIEGWARPGAIIEFFLTDINEGNAVLGDNQLGMTTDYGEGQTYIATVVEGSGTDLDSGTSSYTDLDGNTDTTNKFKFSIPLPSGVAKGEYISATATVGNSTSEFSPFSILKVYTVITNRRITYRVNPN